MRDLASKAIAVPSDSEGSPPPSDFSILSSSEDSNDLRGDHGDLSDSDELHSYFSEDFDSEDWVDLFSDDDDDEDLLFIV